MTLPYREVWLVDFEYRKPDGQRDPEVWCVVALELKSGKKLEIFCDQFGSSPPYDVGPDALFISFQSSAEVACHLALGWPVPTNILDPYVEFMRQVPRHKRVAGNGLLGALTHLGLDALGTQNEKDEGRALAMRGKPFTDAERAQLLHYCGTDVDALGRLLPRITIDLPRALLRGRYMATVAAIERTGTPIDTATLAALLQHWDAIRLALIAEIDKDYGVYEGRTFKMARFEAWLISRGILWPKTVSDRLALDDDTFRAMSKAHPEVSALRELRSSLSEMRLNKLIVGADGRNRVWLNPFGSKTSRNQPGNSKFIFGPSVWLRSLIKPPEGYGLVHIDYVQQEPGIAAALSGDEALKAAYHMGDMYLAFAIQAKAVPPDATKHTHEAKREQFKQCKLALSYGQGAEALADKLGIAPIDARDLLRLHDETYQTFTKWKQTLVNHVALGAELLTVFGWPIKADEDFNPRTFQNYPMQANGAEMMRLAACLAVEAGIEVCAPIHDAFLIMAPLDKLEAHADIMQRCMAEASRVVLDGFELRTEAHFTRWPDRYRDEKGRGDRMWDAVSRLLAGYRL